MMETFDYELYILQLRKEAFAEGIRRGRILGAFDILLEQKTSGPLQEIVDKIVEKYKLPPEEAEGFLFGFDAYIYPPKDEKRPG